MSHRTSLPYLLSTLSLVSMFGMLGCDDGGGGTGGNGGSGGNGGNGGSGNTGGDGGNGGSGGGNGGSGAGGIDLTGGLPACSNPVAQVAACLESAAFVAKPTLPFELDTTGVVLAARAPNAGEACGSLGHEYAIGAYGKAPDVMLDLELSDGSALTVGIAAPGFSAASVTVGETLGVHHLFDLVPAGFAAGRTGWLELSRDAEPVVVIGENLPAVLTPSEGPETCHASPGICVERHMTMEVTAPDGTEVSIPVDQSVEVGDLLVTNDIYFRFYSAGNCNFNFAVEYLMSAVAQ